MRGLVLLLIVTMAVGVARLAAGEVPPATRALVTKHCADCHDAEIKKSGLDLTALSFDLSDRATFDTWVKVVDQVEAGEMPPAKKPQPAAATVTAALTPLRGALRAQGAKQGGSSANRVRRMNRVEYEQTLRDLLVLPALRVKELLPEDGLRHGYDKVASALDLSHIQMTRFMEAAEVALRLAASQPVQAAERKTRREKAGVQSTAQAALAGIKGIPLVDGKIADGYSSRVVGEGANSYRTASGYSGKADSMAILANVLGGQAEGIQFDHFKPAASGLYRVRFSIWGMTWDKNEVKPAATTHVVRASLGDVRLGFFDAPSMKPTTHEFTVWLEPHDRVSFHIMSIPEWGPNNWPSQNGIYDYSGPGVVYDWFEVDGPLMEAGASPSRRRLFGDSGKPDSASVSAVMRTFAERAFRRPVQAIEIHPYIALAEQQMKIGQPLEAALLSAYQAILCAPDCLFIGLEDGVAEASKAKLGAFALASRLSYLLTNGPPDDELLKLAAGGTLSKPAVLRAQAERLLGSPASERFIAHFLDHWLELRKIDFTQPDKDLYPTYDVWLRDGMIAESRAFFRALLNDDRSADHLVSSPFVMIDQRLARHYGIAGVQGGTLRAVAVPAGNPRGGFLTQAAVLKVTANGTATSPVLRGVWVLEHLLGEPRKPPPPNIPAVEPDAKGAVTIREIIEKHRADSACAGCHAKIDPPGLALESFDAIGTWRDHYRPPGNKKQGLAVDSSGQLKNGGVFKDISGLRALLSKDAAALGRNLAKQFLTYGTGSGISFTDRESFDAMVASTKAGNYGVRSLLLAVITSDLFQSK